MPLSEFELIECYLSSAVQRSDVVLGIGDDCALLKVPEGRELAVSIDTLVEGVHFSRDADPETLGHKALGVNLSDLAAMGAEPAWATLALTLPDSDPAWLRAFSRGFSALASTYEVALVGGDITRGPRTISVQVHGFVMPGKALRRSGAQSGDLIYVTGTLGDAALALASRQGRCELSPDQLASVDQHLDRPLPRIAEGRAMVGLASAAIDISDGLAADLGHVLESSGVGASLGVEQLPLSAAVRAYVEASGDWLPALSGGEDYELCFTLPVAQEQAVERLRRRFPCGLTRIGTIDQRPGLRCRFEDGRPLSLRHTGFDHFAR